MTGIVLAEVLLNCYHDAAQRIAIKKQKQLKDLGQTGGQSHLDKQS